MKGITIPAEKLSKALLPLTDMSDLETFQMRDKDAEEAMAAAGMASPQEALLFSVNASHHAWKIQHPGGDNNEIAAVLGLAYSGYPGIGIPWLLGGVHFETVSPIHFAKTSKYVVDLWLAHYRCLMNYVIADYGVAIRWLEFLGFTLSREDYYLHDPNKPFKLFWRYA